MASSRHWFETVEEAQRRAKKRLPKSVYMALVAGSERGITLNDNVDAFSELGFRPHIADLPQNREQATTVLGQDISFPVIISPTGVQAIDPEGEVAVARAAAAAGTAIRLSSFAQPVGGGRRGGQREGVLPDVLGRTRDRILQRVERAQEAGAKALIVTLDWSFATRRDWGSPAIPEKLDLKAMARFAPEAILRPRYLVDWLKSGKLPNLTCPNLAGPGEESPTFFGAYGESMGTPLPPGRTSGGCAKNGVVRSRSRGSCIPTTRVGRSTSAPPRSRCPTTAATTSMAPRPRSGHCPGRRRGRRPDRSAVRRGIRRGSDVVKALAFGAKAVLIGRAYLWGMAAGGETGVPTSCRSCAAASTRRCSAWAARRSTNWSAMI